MLTVRTPAGEWVKRTDAPGAKLWLLKAALNSSTAAASASVYAPVAFRYATRLSITFAANSSAATAFGQMNVTLVNFSNSPASVREMVKPHVT